MPAEMPPMLAVAMFLEAREEAKACQCFVEIDDSRRMAAIIPDGGYWRDAILQTDDPIELLTAAKALRSGWDLRGQTLQPVVSNQNPDACNGA